MKRRETWPKSKVLDLSNQRHETLDACLAFYADYGHRHRRWKRAIKEQKSESKLYERLQALKTDERPLVLAYGAWGLIAGNDPCKRGNPPCIGVGLMRKLSKRFVVAPTPEHCTSKACFRCLGACSPWKEVEEKMHRKVRGLRLCTQKGLHAASQSGQERRDQHRPQLSTSNAGRESDQGYDGGGGGLSPPTNVPRLQ